MSSTWNDWPSITYLSINHLIPEGSQVGPRAAEGSRGAIKLSNPELSAVQHTGCHTAYHNSQRKALLSLFAINASLTGVPSGTSSGVLNASTSWFMTPGVICCCMYKTD